MIIKHHFNAEEFISLAHCLYLLDTLNKAGKIDKNHNIDRHLENFKIILGEKKNV